MRWLSPNSCQRYPSVERRLGTRATSAHVPANASSIRRWDDSGSCQPVRRPSTDGTGRSGVTTTSVQPCPGCTTPRSSVTVASARTDGGAGRDHPTADTAGRVDDRGGRPAAPGIARDTAVRSPRATTRRCGAAAARSARRGSTRSVTSLGVNGAARARHLGAAGLAGEHGLVRLDAATRRARGGTGSGGRARLAVVEERGRSEVELREPQPVRPGEGREQVDRAPCEQLDACGGREPERLGAPGAREPRFDQPEPAGQLAREVHDDRLTVGRRPSSAAGTVADVFTTSRSPGERNSPRSVKVVSTGLSSPGLTSSRTPSRASPRASGGSCASWAGSSVKSSVAPDVAVIVALPLGSERTCALRPHVPRTGRSVGVPSISASRPGTLADGSGRSEMSSPGNASWCISVRMSPGSTTSTRRSGRSSASTRLACSSAAFELAVPAPTLVGLDAGVRRDVHDRRTGSEVRVERLQQRNRRDDVDIEDVAEHVGVDGGRATAAGSRRACWRCSPPAARRRARAAASASSVRCAASVTSPATPTTWVCGPRARTAASSRSRRRASITSAQPSRASASASASPSPWEAPVTTATFLRSMWRPPVWVPPVRVKNKLLLVLMPATGLAARMPFADADGPRRCRDAGARRSTLVEV